MENLFLLAFVAACAVAIIIDKRVRARRRRAEEDAALTGAENAARADEIIRGCVSDLKRQKAGTCGPWLAALIDGPLYLQYDEHGRLEVKVLTKPVTPGIALTAVRMTIAELSGSRFNLDALYRAAGELADMGKGA